MMPADSVAMPAAHNVANTSAPAHPRTGAVSLRDSLAQLRRNAADSVAAKMKADSIRGATLKEGIVMEAPAAEEAPLVNTTSFGQSWITASLLLIFCVVAIRVKNNGRYMTSLLQDLIEVRERHNVFDDTVRETSMLFLLNLQWCASAGVCLYYAVALFNPISPASSASIGAPPVCEALCAALAVGYNLFMCAACFIVGNVFTDIRQARMWLRGFMASQALMGVPLFIIALLLISMPAWSRQLLLIAALTLFIAKILFIWKGLRIFFTRISSWVLFLYYLCSLEIIPLILTYVAATLICMSVP